MCVAICACSDESPIGPNLGPMSYQVINVASGQDMIGPTGAVISLDEAYGVLDGNTGCHRILGSFTLTESNGDSGRASFTVPGLSPNDCSAQDQVLEDLILSALHDAAGFKRSSQVLELFDQQQRPVLLLVLIS